MSEFWTETRNKVLYTMAEAALGIIGSATLLQEINWGLLLSAVMLAGAVTLLKCIIVDLKGVQDDDYLTDEDVEMFEEDEDDYDELEQE